MAVRGASSTRRRILSACPSGRRTSAPSAVPLSLRELDPQLIALPLALAVPRGTAGLGRRDVDALDLPVELAKRGRDVQRIENVRAHQARQVARSQVRLLPPQ